MTGNTTSLPSNNELNKRPSNNTTGTIPEENGSYGGNNTNAGKLSLTRIVEITTLIGGLFALVAFLGSIVITQSNINKDVSTLSSNIETYKSDNILIKTQIENWFDKIDTKLDYLKEHSKP